MFSSLDFCEIYVPRVSFKIFEAPNHFFRPLSEALTSTMLENKACLTCMHGFTNKELKKVRNFGTGKNSTSFEHIL